MTSTPVRFKTAPPVGVLAQTQTIATALAKELGIRNAVLLSPRALRQARGVRLQALMVEEGAWPLTEQALTDLLPCLEHYQGYLLRVARFDPKLIKVH